jgi:hypothetical protein
LPPRLRLARSPRARRRRTRRRRSRRPSPAWTGAIQLGRLAATSPRARASASAASRTRLPLRRMRKPMSRAA